MELKRFLTTLNPSVRSLLIVPYGIETLLHPLDTTEGGDLLIVPYGIETKYIKTSLNERFSFNRTLWN